MKFFQVLTDEEKKVFKKRSEAKQYLKDLKKEDPKTYDSASFDCMEICVDSDTILDILNGNGYASEIIQLDKP